MPPATVRAERRRGPAVVLVLWSVALGWALAPAARAEPPASAVLFACEPAQIDVGDPGAAPYLAAGFHPPEHRERSYAWTSGRARIDLPLAAGGRRTVRMTVLSTFPDQRLELRWNGSGLGERGLNPGWNTLEWQAPDGVTRSGYNRLELIPAETGRVPPDPRQLAVALERVELDPAAPCTGWAQREEEPGRAEGATAESLLRAAEPAEASGPAATQSGTRGAPGGQGTPGEGQGEAAEPSGVARAVPASEPGRDRPAPVTVDPAGAIDIPPGGILLMPMVWPPEARVSFRTTASPGARLRLFAWAGSAYRELPAPSLDDVSRLPSSGNDPTERTEPASASTAETAPGTPAQSLTSSSGGPTAPALSPFDLAAGLHGVGGLAAVAEGGGVRLTGLGVSGDDGGWAWRRACRLPWLEAALLALLAAVLVVARVVLRRRPELAEWGSRWTPWLDAAAVVAVALAVRWAFLQLYPEPGRSADAFEYLMRSRRLAEGRLSLLHDTRWHAWQTWIRAPGYYLFLAGVLGPLGGTAVTAIRLQAVLSAVAAGATTWMGGRLFGRIAGLVAGLWLALYVEAIASFSRILSEPLYMLLLVPALAALAAVAARPSWRSAALAGALFGLAALVRSAPVYFVPLAALLLLAVHGRRRGWRPAAAMVAAMVAVILPWCVRNSLLYGAPMGIDDLAVANLLQVSPDHRFVPVDDLDLDTARGYRTYYNRLQRANLDRRLGRQGGAVTRATLANLAGHPVRTLRRFGGNLGEYFAPASDAGFFARIHREARRCRAALATDLANFQYLAMLALAVVGAAITRRDRRGWPLLLWFVFNAAIINLLFHPEPKYRFPTLPVAMVFAAVAVARWLEARPGGATRGRKARVLDSARSADPEATQ